MKPIQQGDILLIPATHNPADAYAQPRDACGRAVFARGATGHVHALAADDPGEVFIDAQGRTILVVPAGGTVLRHLDEASGAPTQDHAAVQVPAGTWEIRRQREVRWGESAQVED